MASAPVTPADVQKLTAQAIVNIFETGTPAGAYDKVTLLAGDPGHLTYGRSQTTLASGNLYLLLKAYCDGPGAYVDEIRPYLNKVLACDLTLDSNAPFRALLHDAGADPVMHQVQDGFFDRVYWYPAIKYAAACRLTCALGNGVVYDSVVHGSFALIRDKTNLKCGPATPEHEWIETYVQTRRDWLANHSNVLLHQTVYRMDTFNNLIAAGKWNLELPLTVRGRTIDEAVLLGGTPTRASAAGKMERLLRPQRSPMRGPDVRNVQKALSAAGLKCPQNGAYDKNTVSAVRKFQAGHGLTADGLVGPATRAALGL
jgi:chitosanase